MVKRRNKKQFTILLIILLSVFIIINVIAAVQAYKFTHFQSDAPEVPREQGVDLPFLQKMKIGLMGLDMGKPKAKTFPDRRYKNILIPVNEKDVLAAWKINTDSISKGIILLFHGYMDEKSSMLDRAYALLDLGYDVLLTDFSGAGCSYGMKTTVGHNEAKDIKVVYDYVVENIQKENIYLLGFSMGAVAIIKAQHDYQMNVKSLILEAPYATFEETIGARFDQVGVPRFPMASLMIFWGGIENDFDPYKMRPIDFVTNITVPTLLMCGMLDENISIEETKSIFNNFATERKVLKMFAESKHESYLLKHDKEWKNAVHNFLNE